MVDTCPKCGGIAVLIQATDESVDVPDLSAAQGKVKIHEKVEEFRCQNPSCEHEFEKIIKEPSQS